MASEPVETTNMSAGSDALSSSATRQSRVRKREDAIISAGRQVFTSHGYAKATMAMIAREAGVADGTLHGSIFLHAITSHPSWKNAVSLKCYRY